MKEKNANLLLMIGLVVAIIAIGVGASYAYFTAVISGAETGTTINIGSSSISIAYSGASNTIVASNIVPGWQGTKNFTVTGNNPTSQQLGYDLKLDVNSNTFSTNAIKYYLTKSSSGGCTVGSAGSPTGIATGSGTRSMCSSNFAANSNSVAHTYTLHVLFPDTNTQQNDEQGKTFKASITVTSSTRFSTSV